MIRVNRLRDEQLEKRLSRELTFTFNDFDSREGGVGREVRSHLGPKNLRTLYVKPLVGITFLLFI